MPFLRDADVRALGYQEAQYNEVRAKVLLSSESKSFSTQRSYDVFLSHSFKDAMLILGVKVLLKKHGIDAYVDWVDDPSMDREKVTPETAAILRTRLRSCKSLVYVHSTNSKDSAWMPWELGYFDGFKTNFVWILPIVHVSDSEFKGQEYLGLYPVIEVTDIPARLAISREYSWLPKMEFKEAIRSGMSMKAATGRG